MNTETSSHLPSVLVVTLNRQHKAFFENNLSPYFSISTHRDIDWAMGENFQEPAEVIVVDQNGRYDRNSERFMEHSNHLDGKGPSLLTIAGPDIVFAINEKELNVPARFLRWPVSPETLRKAISWLIGEKAEQAWREMPDEIGRPLTLTVEEYRDISDAIAKGEPIDYTGASESCKPLADAVASGNHHTLLKSVQAHHNYTYVHSMRVATLLTLFGHDLGIRGDDLLILSTGGLIHDVGKLVTPKHILDKPGKLSEEEWPVMRDHVIRSSELLRMSPDVTRGALIIAEQHHEKIDGSGYPKGLKGVQLNELARMSAIVDIFGALTDARSYKPAYDQEKAFEILESMPTQIDQNLGSVFRSFFEPGSDLAEPPV